MLETLRGKRDLVGAEIGVEQGHGAFDMLTNLDIKKFYLIDPYEKGPHYFPMAKERLRDFEDKIVWIKNRSDAVSLKTIPEQSLDFVYIDGNHCYEYVLKDCLLYYPRVKIGGIIGGHDYYPRRDGKEDSENGVDQAVHDFCVTYELTKVLQIKNKDWWFVK